MRAHELVLERIERDLADGALAIGDRLPGSGHWPRSCRSAGPRCVRRSGCSRRWGGAHRGGLRTRRGATVVADPSSSIGSALRLHTATRHLPIADLVDTRILLESWALREAAHRRPRPDLTAVEAILDAMDEVALSPEEFLRLDAAFHVAMSELAGNVVVGAMMAALRDSIHGYVLAGVPLLDDWPVVATTLCAEHRAILNAVRRGHGARAGKLRTRTSTVTST